MAITISGENNNDRILASDGVIDQLSGFNVVGVLTATSFTGDLTGNVTGNVTGNLTGNVNSTSNLLLQIGGSEKFRVGGSGQLGIAGANYGTSGQVLTSGGSGSAVSWTTIPTQVTISSNANNRIITGGSGTNLVGEANLTWDGSVLSATGSDAQLRLYDSTASSENSAFRLMAYNGVNMIQSGKAFSSDSKADLVFGSMFGGSEFLRINSSGQVSLGNNPTVASDAALHIELDGAREYLRLDADSGNNAYIEIEAPNNRRKAIIFKSGGTRRGVIGVGDSDEAANATSLFLSASTNIGGDSPHMSIHSSGYVGVNDTSANARFIVSGNSDTSDADCQIRIYDMDTTVGSQIPSLSFWGGSTQLAYIRGTSSGLRFYTGSSGSMAFSGAFDNSQRLLLGNDSNIQVDSSNPRLQVIGTSDSTAHLSIGNFSASVTPATLSLVKSRGSVGAANAVQDDDIIGKINFVGADGTDLTEVSGKILVACDAAVANNRVPSRMEFYNTDGSGNLDLNMVLTRDGQMFLPSGETRDNMHSYCHSTANDFAFGKPSATADTGMTIVSNPSYSSFINFSDGSSGTRQGSIVYQHGSGTDTMFFRTNNNQNALVIDSEQKIGVRTTQPQTALNVIGTISAGRNVARELGTIINISSNHNAARSGGNVISGHKNYETGSQDWLAAGNARVNANLTIDLGTAISCDRFVIYNQNEYNHSNREVKNFTLEGSNDNSNWTTVLDDDCGCSHGHEPNPGFSFRIPAGNVYGVDDDEGLSYRYWRFTMKTFHGSDSYGGVCELELYQTGTGSNAEHVGSEVTTSSLSAGDVHTERLDGLKMITSSKGLNIHTGEDASDTWEITERGKNTSGSYYDKSTIRHKGGVMAVSSFYNTGDLFIRIDNLTNLSSNAWWVCGVLILSNEIQGGQGGGHHYVTSLQLMGLASWNSVTAQNIVGSMSVSVNQSGSNYVELYVNVNDSSRGPCTVICNGGAFDPPRISFH